jgi:hypothetical protein
MQLCNILIFGLFMSDEEVCIDFRFLRRAGILSVALLPFFEDISHGDKEPCLQHGLFPLILRV